MSAFFTKLSRTGRIAIPIELREQMALKNGIQMSVELKGDAIVLRPVTPRFIRELRGLAKGAGAVREREHRKDRY